MAGQATNCRSGSFQIKALRVLLRAGLAPAFCGRATSPRGAERRVLEHAGLVLDQLDAAVEGPVLDHLEGDVRVAVVDAFCARGPGDHREHPDSEAVDESGP